MGGGTTVTMNGKAQRRPMTAATRLAAARAQLLARSVSPDKSKRLPPVTTTRASTTTARARPSSAPPVRPQRPIVSRPKLPPVVSTAAAPTHTATAASKTHVSGTYLKPPYGARPASAPPPRPATAAARLAAPATATSKSAAQARRTHASAPAIAPPPSSSHTTGRSLSVGRGRPLKRNTPAYSFGERISVKHPATDVPGPGQYNSADIGGIGSKRHTQRARTFCARFSAPRVAGPGPGEYNLGGLGADVSRRVSRARPASAPPAPRFRQPTGSAVGPGDYDVTRSYSKLTVRETHKLSLSHTHTHTPLPALVRSARTQPSSLAHVVHARTSPLLLMMLVRSGFNTAAWRTHGTEVEAVACEVGRWGCVWLRLGGGGASSIYAEAFGSHLEFNSLAQSPRRTIVRAFGQTTVFALRLSVCVRARVCVCVCACV